MVNKIRKDILISAIIITVCIFLIGLYIGKIWDNFRTDNVESNLFDNDLNLLSILVSQEFSSHFNITDCELIGGRLSSMSYDLYQVGKRLSDYENKNLFDKKEYNYLKTQYFLSEIKLYMHYLDFKKSCDSNQNIILFFYDIDDIDSERQGYVLDKLVEREDVNLRVFSIDRQHEEATINMIKDFYGIKKSPTMIINNGLKEEGFYNINDVLVFIENE